MESVIKYIANEAAKRGHEVTIRDIAYALLRVKFEDDLIAFTVIKGSAPEKDSDVTDYDSMDKIRFLVHWFEKDLAPKESGSDYKKAIDKALNQKQVAKNKEELAISADENFEGAVEQLKRVKELRDRCQSDDIKTLRDLEKMELEIRVKLVDKWDMQKTEADEKIITPKVYDYICPWTRRECYQIGKEEAMEKWNLIEKE